MIGTMEIRSLKRQCNCVTHMSHRIVDRNNDTSRNTVNAGVHDTRTSGCGYDCSKLTYKSTRRRQQFATATSSSRFSNRLPFPFSNIDALAS